MIAAQGATPFCNGHVAEMAWMMNAVAAHCSLRSLASAATSGRPVAAPLLSTQLVIGETSGLKRGLPPSAVWERGRALPPSSLSLGSSLLSHVLTFSCRQAMPPLALT